VRILAIWGKSSDSQGPVEYPNVFVPPIEVADLFDDLFTPIARDGAAIVEVGIRLQKAFQTLALFGSDDEYADNARRHSREAMERAEIALTIESDRRRLREVAAELHAFTIVQDR
jgi:uncharacterized membrane protein